MSPDQTPPPPDGERLVGEPPVGEPPPRAARKPPSAYRPDLRPMLILAAVLLGVILGWIVLSPLILPQAVR